MEVDLNYATGLDKRDVRSRTARSGNTTVKLGCIPTKENCYVMYISY